MKAEWPKRPLGELTVNHDGKRRPVKEADRRPGPYPYYGASGIVDYVDEYLIDGDYLLIAEDGENLRTRKTQIAFMARGKSWVNNHAHIVTGNAEADTEFLMYALAVTDISGYLTGAVMPKLSQANLNKIEVPCPPLEVQREIVSKLKSLDDKIELNRRMNQTLEAIARALFKSWFVDFDPVRAKAEGRDTGLPKRIADLFPDRFVDSERGEIPEGWSISEIGKEVETVGGGTPSTKNSEYWDGGISWATPKDLSSLSAPVLLETSRTISERGLEKISSGLLPEGTVLMSSRAPVGYLAIAAKAVAINQGFIAMKCNRGLPNYYVLNWAMESMGLIKSNASGSTFAEISKKSFRPIPVLVPSERVLSAFIDTVTPLYENIEMRLREANKLSQFRDLLLPKLLSGELSAMEAA